MPSRTYAAAVILAASMMPGGAVEAARPGCDRAAAATLVGKAAPSDARARSVTGARTIRRITPGQPVTKDYRVDRLTLEIDGGKVFAASCG